MNLAGTDEDGIPKQKLSRNSKVCAARRILPVRLMMILIDFSSARGRPWVLNTNFFWLWMTSLAYCFRFVSSFSHDSTAGHTQGCYKCCFILVINTCNKQKHDIPLIECMVVWRYLLLHFSFVIRGTFFSAWIFQIKRVRVVEGDVTRQGSWEIFMQSKFMFEAFQACFLSFVLLSENWHNSVKKFRQVIES